MLQGHYYVKFLFIGLAALLSGVAALLLPETLGRQMPETLQDGEKIPICLPWRKIPTQEDLRTTY